MEILSLMNMYLLNLLILLVQLFFKHNINQVPLLMEETTRDLCVEG